MGDEFEAPTGMGALPPRTARVPQPVRRREPPIKPRARRVFASGAVAIGVFVGGMMLWRYVGTEPPAPIATPATPVAAAEPAREAGDTAVIEAEPPSPTAAPRVSARPTQDGETVHVPTPRATPAPAPSEAVGFGHLIIQTTPWAAVFLDGQDIGRNTPIRDLPVSAGPHRIGLRTTDGTMHEEMWTVPAGETVRLVRQL